MKKPSPEKFKFHASLIMIGFGLFLMIVKISSDGEPGAIPLLLLVSGIVWAFIHHRKNMKREQNI